MSDAQRPDKRKTVTEVICDFGCAKIALNEIAQAVGHTGDSESLVGAVRGLVEDRSRLDWREAHPRHGFGLYSDGMWADGRGGSHSTYRSALDAARSTPASAARQPESTEAEAP